MRKDDEDELEREFLALQRRVSVHPGRVKSKRAKEAFVHVPLWWAEAAAKAMGSPKTFIAIWLLHLAWKAKSNTFSVPNGRLGTHGVHRWTKDRVLSELERAGLIAVERMPGKTAIVTLVVR